MDEGVAVRLRRFGLLGLGFGFAGFLVWKAVVAPDGVTDPTGAGIHLSGGAVVLDSGLLVFREGLEAILVLAAVTASFIGANRSLRRPVGAGALLALATSVGTWFLAIAVIGALGGPGLDVQAGTGLLAVVVLLVVMNWFFHRLYWTGWISHHNRRRKRLQGQSGSRITLGLVLLGFTAIYREGFEIVLFLQNLRIKDGNGPVIEGTAIGLALTAAVGALTFAAHHRLPYKKMLVLTGVLLGFVLVVMVGESTQELQQAGWLTATSIGIHFPGFVNLWFATFPTVEGLAAQALAASAVLGSYFLAEYYKVRRPRSRGLKPATRSDQAPANTPATAGREA